MSNNDYQIRTLLVMILQYCMSKDTNFLVTHFIYSH